MPKISRWSTIWSCREAQPRLMAAAQNGSRAPSSSHGRERIVGRLREDCMQLSPPDTDIPTIKDRVGECLLQEPRLGFRHPSPNAHAS